MSLSSFYNNRNVFITGGTGYLGKVLIEKLLRSTKVSKIYVLIRPKKGQNANERLSSLFDSALFEKIREDRRDRVIAISGDCARENLALDENDRRVLTDAINIVFHCAANTRFVENIKVSFRDNVQGTVNLLQLCREMKNLKVVVHVSTLYCYGFRGETEEVVYDVGPSFEEVGAKLEETENFLAPWDYTYVYTKALTERTIQEKFGDLPVGIFRPALVTSSYQEPVKNWTDSSCAFHLIFKYASLGYARLYPCSPYKVDPVPVDLTISAVIASAFDTSKSKVKLPVYNFTTAPRNPINFQKLFALIARDLDKNPLRGSLRTPSLQVREYSSWTYVLMVAYHCSFALFLDFMLVVLLKRPKHCGIVKRMHKLFWIYKDFTCKKLEFSGGNVGRMWEEMGEEDREEFNFDMGAVEWEGYLGGYFEGLKKYWIREI